MACFWYAMAKDRSIALCHMGIYGDVPFRCDVGNDTVPELDEGKNVVKQKHHIMVFVYTVFNCIYTAYNI